MTIRQTLLFLLPPSAACARGSRAAPHVTQTRKTVAKPHGPLLDFRDLDFAKDRRWILPVSDTTEVYFNKWSVRWRNIMLPGTRGQCLKVAIPATCRYQAGRTVDLYGTQLAAAEPFLLDPERLLRLAERNRRQYGEADPYPNIVIDDFLPNAVLERVLSEIPRPGEISWIESNDARGKKLASKVETQLGAATRALLYQLNSSVFIDFLETLTGIRGLIPDPHLWGGGVHQIVRGGFLKVHSDFNRHPRLKLDRRLNLLLYLNPGWQEEWGGHLELWDRDMTQCRKKFCRSLGDASSSAPPTLRITGILTHSTAQKE